MRILECFECIGEGYIEGSTPQCNKPSSVCCGGCYPKYECKLCDGLGVLHSNDEIILDYFEILNAYKTIMIGLMSALHEVDRLKKRISEDSQLEMDFLLNTEYQEEKENIKRQMKRIERHTQILHAEIKENLK